MNIENSLVREEMFGMNAISSCRFCDIIAGKYHYTGIDEPFSDSAEFVALASIGPLVEGWSLIVPKEHQLSMRSFYAKPGFANFMRSVLPPLIHRYGSLIAFEHGANKEGSITACGTDHAHLHLVPFDESLLPELQNSGLQWIHCRSSEIVSKTGKNEYLFYSELDVNGVWKDPMGYLHILEYPLSQYFRRLIADRKGITEVSDYKLFPHLDVARQTRKNLVRPVA